MAKAGGQFNVSSVTQTEVMAALFACLELQVVLRIDVRLQSALHRVQLQPHLPCQLLLPPAAHCGHACLQTSTALPRTKTSIHTQSCMQVCRVC